MAANRNLLTGFLFKRGKRRGAASLIKDRTNDASDVVLDSWLFDAPLGGTNYTLTALHGTYSLTGQGVTVSRNRALTASRGTYAVSGQSALALRSSLISALRGTYSVSGQDAVLDRTTLIGYTLTCEHGSYAVSGQSISLLRSRLLEAQSAAYETTGQAASIEKDRTLTAEPGVYALSGQSATLAYAGTANHYTLTCLHGSYRSGGGYVDPGYWDDGYTEGCAVITVTPQIVTGGYSQYKYLGNRQSEREKELERIKLGIIEAKQEAATVAKQKTQAIKAQAQGKEPRQDVYALTLHEALIREEIARLMAQEAILKASLAQQFYEVRQRLAVQEAMRLAAIRQQTIEADLAFVMTMLIEA